MTSHTYICNGCQKTLLFDDYPPVGNPSIGFTCPECSKFAQELASEIDARLQMCGEDGGMTKDNYQRVKGYKSLNDQYKPLFQQLHAVREKHAKIVNMPSANIISNNLLINIASGTQTLDYISFPNKFKENLRNRIMRDLRKVIESSVFKNPREEY